MKAEIYPVITLYQPWATWIMREWKTIETRTHAKFACLLNKTVLIHAGMTTDKTAIPNPYLTDEENEDGRNMINGFILGHAHVYDFMILDRHDSRASLIDCEHTDRFGLFLDKITKFPFPIPAKGEMGIWYFDVANNVKCKKPTFQPILF